MKIRWILVPAVILAAIAIYFASARIVKPGTTHTTQQSREVSSNAQSDPSTQTSPAQTDSRLRRLSNGFVEYRPALETSRAISTAKTPEEMLTLIQQVFSHYRFAYKENPVGVENFEITEQLLGKNPKKIIFIDKDNPALRGNELIDHWNTPYFFHALSSQIMEVYSAGPDKILWTEDDIGSLGSTD